ncbi:MAG: SAM-dependent methyltransferase [Paracoccus sp. (in: a-proteobacteria)]|uniref:class I SAM-dependent methyltransferase n=1 Tax=Paracoccus sp. TaxID=267 RepID=UPI0026E113CF|nr:SAM-dependent methyltransferase [Paracoccus sp. (in: a-proteobacteria)]MDO5620544.1 SAM-dependent methyltransferase [Paracoccus sp. (in: a-proteobacteria)]
MTPLGRIIADRIRAFGPMSLHDYMQTCLLHPDHGYYATRDPFGRAGDFITAPEINQIFGEVIGLALAQAWLDQGSPAPFTLAEPGPGRGTLMADMRRVMARVPGMLEAADTVLIEASPHLRQVQAGAVPQARHLDSLSDLPQAPLFLVANEFLDALPIRQYQRVEGGWSERMVTLDDNGLTLALAAPLPLPRRGQVGDIFEDRPATTAIVTEIASRIAAHGGAAILIDYGNWDGQGDSFQALRDHRPEDPLAYPGQADLTSHVDFAPIAAAARAAGAEVSAMVTQGDLLLALGAAERAGALVRAGDPGAAEALTRLVAPDQMGQLFKALAIWPRGAAPVAGFVPPGGNE